MGRVGAARMGECFNCSGAAARTYTLVLRSGRRLEDRWLCRACHAFFSETAAIEVLGSPVLVGPAERIEESEE